MSDCPCKARTIPNTLLFEKCQRGFVLRESGDYSSIRSTTYAFDRVQDLAAWLIDNFGEQVHP